MVNQIKISFLKKIYLTILGDHPKNTIFSFNYHNIKHINYFLRKAISGIESNQNVIADIGCGECPYNDLFSPVAVKYIAIDNYEENIINFPCKQIEYKTGVAENLPLEDKSCDIALCNQVLEHVNDPIKSVKECFRVLKPDGLFIGSVPHISPVHLEPIDFRRFTDLGLKKLLEEGGFTNINIEGNCGVYSSAAFMISMNLVLSKRSEGKPQKFSPVRSILFSPLVGILNIMGLVFDKITDGKHRCPSNLCWSATKP